MDSMSPDPSAPPLPSAVAPAMQSATLATPADPLTALTPPVPGPDFGFASFLVQADYVILTVLGILLLMSIASWFIILTKGLQVYAAKRRAGAAVRAFWAAESLPQALSGLASRVSGDDPFALLAQAGASAAQHYRKQSGRTLGETCDASDFITRALRQAIETATARLESGLTVLASVGSTAPFVGLFGTVWGIYHALVRIGVTGQASLEQVAGPVGEALIMTAVGLGVAIPAVLAYNAFVRANRLLLAGLDGFAFDLHAYLTMGARITDTAEGPTRDASVTPLQSAQEVTA